MRVGLITPGSVADATGTQAHTRDSPGSTTPWASPSATSKPGRRPSRMRRCARTRRRGMPLSSPTGSSSRMRRSGSRRSIPPPPSSSRPDAVFTAARAPDLPARGGELSGRHGGGNAHQEQLDRVRGRDRAAADRSGVPGVGEWGDRGESAGAFPQGLPEQLRQHRGRTGGRACADPRRRRHVHHNADPGGAGRFPGSQGESRGSISSAPTRTRRISRRSGWWAAP